MDDDHRRREAAHEERITLEIHITITTGCAACMQRATVHRGTE